MNVVEFSSAGQLLVPLLLLVGGGLVGRRLEKRHFTDIAERERRYAKHSCTTTSGIPANLRVIEATLVAGSVVVSLDYFKRFVAGLKSLVGGRLKAYEPLLERARREAMLRMRERAIEGGFDRVINVRLETSRLAAGGADGRRTVGVEILAFGTAIKTGVAAS